MLESGNLTLIIYLPTAQVHHRDSIRIKFMAISKHFLYIFRDVQTISPFYSNCQYFQYLLSYRSIYTSLNDKSINNLDQ